MSIDFRIQNVCDHYINWERLYIEDDLKTIKLGRILAAEKSFQLRINGSTVTPSMYKFSTEEVNLTVEKNTSVIFFKKIRLYRPLVEVHYTTSSVQCPKCSGIKVIDDIKYNTEGDVSTIDRELQLIQNVEKYIITKIGSSSFHPWFGTNLYSLVGIKIGNFDLIKSQIVEQVSDAIGKLKDIQRQLIGSGRIVTAGELFAQLLNISVEQSPIDPTIVNVLVKFTAQSGKQLEFEQLFEFSQLRERVNYP